LKQSISSVESLRDAEKALNAGKMVFAPWCGTESCEEKFKEKTGAKSLNAPFEQPKMRKDQQCFACKEKAASWFYFGRSY